MRPRRRETRWIGAGAMTISLLAAVGVSFAAAPSNEQAQMCNERAAQAAARTYKGSEPQHTDSSIATNHMRRQPGPGAGQPGAPSTAAGGRITDSSQPGGSEAVDVLQGMGAAGRSDPAYRQSYVACMRQLGY